MPKLITRGLATSRSHSTVVTTSPDETTAAGAAVTSSPDEPTTVTPAASLEISLDETAAAAIIPDMVRNTLKDHMAENGITEEDLDETARKLHPAPKKQ